MLSCADMWTTRDGSRLPPVRLESLFRYAVRETPAFHRCGILSTRKRTARSVTFQSWMSELVP